MTGYNMITNKKIKTEIIMSDTLFDNSKLKAYRVGQEDNYIYEIWRELPNTFPDKQKKQKLVILPQQGQKWFLQIWNTLIKSIY